MASKLRRVPLFGMDSGFGLKPKNKGIPPFHMECEVSSTQPAAYNGAGSGNKGNPPVVAPNGTVTTISTPVVVVTSASASASSPATAPAPATAPGPATASAPVVVKTNNGNNGTGSGKSQLHVDFIENGEVKEKREKYLTAKYGSHQMSLIRKRLAVEMWLYDELQNLYEDENGKAANHDVEIDLDEVLDMEGDEERRKFLLPLLKDAKKSQEVVNKFVDEVISKAKTL